MFYFLFNDLEKINGFSIFDMEKYFKKIEVSRFEGDFLRVDMFGICDLFLLKERII